MVIKLSTLNEKERHSDCVGDMKENLIKLPRTSLRGFALLSRFLLIQYDDG